MKKFYVGPNTFKAFAKIYGLEWCKVHLVVTATIKNTRKGKKK